MALVRRSRDDEDQKHGEDYGGSPPRARRVTVKIGYGTTDVEKAAESMELQVSDEEVEAILANIDSELSTLATTATPGSGAQPGP